MNEIEENGGEINDEVVAKLEITENQFKEKLSDYRKAYTSIRGEVEACKQEAKRIAEFIKVKENTGARLRETMLRAVMNFGYEGKNGNKKVKLDDALLYTTTRKNVDLNADRLSYVIAACLNQLRLLYQAGMTREADFNGHIQTVDINTFVDKMNERFKALYQGPARAIEEDTGHLFTSDDLSSARINITFNVSLSDLLTADGYDIANVMYDNESTGNVKVEPAVQKPTLKEELSLGTELTFAKLVNESSLTIK